MSAKAWAFSAASPRPGTCVATVLEPSRDVGGHSGLPPGGLSDRDVAENKVIFLGRIDHGSVGDQWVGGSRPAQSIRFTDAWYK
jgi:hypothetical protein